MSKVLQSNKVVLSIDGRELVCSKSETVLSAAHRHGVQLSFSCQSGNCQVCMVKALKGSPSAKSQRGLKSTLVAQGYFLACQQELNEDLAISVAGANGAFSSVQVISNQALSSDVYRLRLSLPADFSYHSGQYINILHESGEIRSYSLASDLQLDEFLEIHIRRIPAGIVSNWLANNALPGKEISISGPCGDCFYVSEAEKMEKPILLLGTGTGLAPLYGILRCALAQGHRGEIFLYHGASTKDQLYLMDELRGLEERQSNFHYLPCLSGQNERFGFREGRANEVAFSDIKDLKDYLVYLCGNPEMVKGAKRMAFMQGAAMHDIFADPFERSQASTGVTSS